MNIYLEESKGLSQRENKIERHLPRGKREKQAAGMIAKHKKIAYHFIMAMIDRLRVLGFFFFTSSSSLPWEELAEARDPLDAVDPLRRRLKPFFKEDSEESPMELRLLRLCEVLSAVDGVPPTELRDS